ncbi:ABC transporter ATP-binding protein [Cellulomonas bogoriensis]|uniref:Sulfate ABC transporter ATPase n=1 Tax=Cellulomonas bogoriensis 69B4 = DSM 16987 TaxID=1386082 RepID=A0A0A0BYT8_9CELL|nr:ABC transporter ATP-binding protein [Cellulomonas bogoriensis]KGM13120.1 sulfate ABC transporter ATPase [Cellulomonas bogoriensis 69B4 = DSM 16987]
MAVLEIEDLRKVYGGRAVVDGVSLTVDPGEIVGVLGRNGAGKTTTVECGIGLRRPDGGRVRVLGVDPRAERARVQQVIGVQLQRTHVHMSLTVTELVHMYRSFYRDGLDPDALVERLGLTEARDTRAENLSGGQLQRLSIALALVGRPRLAVLDELTTGLDPAARRGMWGLIEEMRDDGIAVLLVSHVMEEAERLSDRIAVIDAGKVVALDTPAGLIARVDGADAVTFRVHAPLQPTILTDLPGVDEVSVDGEHVRVAGPGNLVTAVTQTLMQHAIPATDFRTRTATLDDAFLQLTGYELGEPEPPKEAK